MSVVAVTVANKNIINALIIVVVVTVVAVTIANENIINALMLLVLLLLLCQNGGKIHSSKVFVCSKPYFSLQKMMKEIIEQKKGLFQTG